MANLQRPGIVAPSMTYVFVPHANEPKFAKIQSWFSRLARTKTKTSSIARHSGPNRKPNRSRNRRRWCQCLGPEAQKEPLAGSWPISCWHAYASLEKLIPDVQKYTQYTTTNRWHNKCLPPSRNILLELLTTGPLTTNYRPLSLRSMHLFDSVSVAKAMINGPTIKVNNCLPLDNLRASTGLID
uniref:HDC15791 n=1 Tax=Drosophila melanogaster TaxID=7227 RepID=Q6IJ67_DROME|nr:TPA_inf: HDC15791 [Drosophila melanogaster]